MADRRAPRRPNQRTRLGCNDRFDHIEIAPHLLCVRAARKRRGRELQESVDAPLREQQTAGRADRAEDEPFGDQLSRDLLEESVSQRLVRGALEVRRLRKSGQRKIELEWVDAPFEQRGNALGNDLQR